eukprot:630604-Amphidinium_carterae.1
MRRIGSSRLVQYVVVETECENLTLGDTCSQTRHHWMHSEVPWGGVCYVHDRRQDIDSGVGGADGSVRVG